ncbi:MAG: ISAs1 family transposase [Holosporaceae bacterium]|jgi:predicted transposase YbfD/YdcC|nr:ISAs1 family transposase [Holosporaceae bacterium]
MAKKGTFGEFFENLLESPPENEIADSFVDAFGDLADPRGTRNRLYPLHEILFAALVGALIGAESWTDVEIFAHTHLELMRKYFPYKNGAPSDDTFRRVFRALDPNVFQEMFRRWIISVLPQLESCLIAIDGKTSRGSVDNDAPDSRALHMVSAYATEANIVLAQEKVAGKSNEIRAIPKLIDWLDLKGATVTIDAMGCQYEIANKILDKGGQYILALKGNQESIHDDVILAFRSENMPGSISICEDFDKGHGRIETRKCTVLTNIEWLGELHPKWKPIKAIVHLESIREMRGKTTNETRYYVASKEYVAKEMLKMIRSHWSIENSVHWILDMSFGEDQSRIRKENAPQNMAIIRHMALNLLKMTKKNNDKLKRVSIKGLRKMAGWNPSILNCILSQNFS